MTALEQLAALRAMLGEPAAIDFKGSFKQLTHGFLFVLSLHKTYKKEANMDLNTLAQIGEFLGGLSVLLTLIYLAIQIRGNTKVVRSTGAQQTHDSMVELYRELAKDAELNRIFRVGTQDMTSLSEDEIGRVMAFWSATLYTVQNWLYQSDNGVLEETLVMTWLGGVASNFHADGFRLYWDDRKFMFSVPLQNWVEEIMSKPPAHGDYATLGMGKKPDTSQH
jgi:hypothetical protein